MILPHTLKYTHQFQKRATWTFPLLSWWTMKWKKSPSKRKNKYDRGWEKEKPREWEERKRLEKEKETEKEGWIWKVTETKLTVETYRQISIYLIYQICPETQCYFQYVKLWSVAKRERRKKKKWKRKRKNVELEEEMKKEAEKQRQIQDEWKTNRYRGNGSATYWMEWKPNSIGSYE